MTRISTLARATLTSIALLPLMGTAAQEIGRAHV